jgi:hypothetical protein
VAGGDLVVPGPQGERRVIAEPGDHGLATSCLTPSASAKIAVDLPSLRWDNPTMTTTADSKKRVVLPTARPGDVFDVQRQGEGLFVLVRLARPELKTRLTRAQCLRAIAKAPLHPKMDWETLRAMTREP